MNSFITFVFVISLCWSSYKAQTPIQATASSIRIETNSLNSNILSSNLDSATIVWSDAIPIPALSTIFPQNNQTILNPVGQKSLKKDTTIIYSKTAKPYPSVLLSSPGDRKLILIEEKK